MKDKKEQKLTVKQRLFNEYYIANGGNGTQAAIDAGYSPHTAAVIASENLSKPYIHEAKEKRMSEIAAKVGLTPELILGTVTDIVKMEKNEKTIGHILKGCELGGKHLKLFTDKTESEVNVKPHEDWLEIIK